MDNKQRPGVLIYFDRMVPALNRLNNEQAGALLRAIVLYALNGTEPDLEDLPGVVFDLIRPGIDTDWIRYGTKRIRSQYANYCKKMKAKGEEPLPFSDFMQCLSEPDGDQMEPSGFLTEPDRNRADSGGSVELKLKLKQELKPELKLKLNNTNPVSLSDAHAREGDDRQTTTDTTQTETSCEVCGRRITEGVASYSRDKFGRYLCQKCQVTHGPTAPPPPKKTGNSYGTPDPATVRSAYQQLLAEEAELEGVTE